MDCLCSEKDSNELKIEADFGADPFWCSHCGCNLEIEDFPLSPDLKNKLLDWISDYGKWFNMEEDRLLVNGIAMETRHNKQGELLAEEVQNELTGKYKVKFSPATMAKRYSKSKNEGAD